MWSSSIISSSLSSRKDSTSPLSMRRRQDNFVWMLAPWMACERSILGTQHSRTLFSLLLLEALPLEVVIVTTLLCRPQISLVLISVTPLWAPLEDRTPP
jgi:hypothetical protein